MNANKREGSAGWQARQLEVDKQHCRYECDYHVKPCNTCGLYPTAIITIKPKMAVGTPKRGLVELAGIEPATS